MGDFRQYTPLNATNWNWTFLDDMDKSEAQEVLDLFDMDEAKVEKSDKLKILKLIGYLKKQKIEHNIIKLEISSVDAQLFDQSH